MTLTIGKMVTNKVVIYISTSAGLLAAWAKLTQAKPESALPDCVQVAANVRSGGPSLLSLTLHRTMAQPYLRLGGRRPLLLDTYDRIWRQIARQLGIYPAVIKYYGQKITITDA